MWDLWRALAALLGLKGIFPVRVIERPVFPHSARSEPSRKRQIRRVLFGAASAASLAGCAPATPSAPVFTCPSFPYQCQDFQLEGVSIDPVNPSEPMCPMLGEFRDQFEFQLCRCEYEQYVGELIDRAACIGKRRVQMATAVYNEMVRVYNCRLRENGCTPATRIRFGLGLSAIDYSNRPPDLPGCVTFLTNRPFYDRFEAETCRSEVEQLEDDLLSWAEREAEDALFEARRDADRAVERFNCYARGGKFCL